MGDFAKVFRALRLRDNLTQEQLAKILEISKSAISMYENGNREPDLETLERIADCFEVDIDCLLGRSLKTSSRPLSITDTFIPTYDDIQSLIARNGKKLSLKQKQDLIKTLLSD
jgi:Predicted transcriptional regulators